MEVSVIVPVYNSKKYIKACIESLLKEDFHSYEILLIDDGSSDGSQDICDSFANNSCVRVFHKENGGVCSARNYGLQKATGKYIMFADNDDRIISGFINDNYELAEKEKADFVRFNQRTIKVLKNGKVQVNDSKLENKVLYKKEFYKDYFAVRASTCWSAMYKSEILKKNNIIFDERIKTGQEDLIFNLNYLRYVDKIAFNSRVYYCWIQREEHSTSLNVTDYNNYLFAQNERQKKETDFIKTLQPKLNNVVIAQEMSNYIYLTAMLINRNKISKKEVIKIYDNIKQYELFNVIDEKCLFNEIPILSKEYFILKLFHKRQYRSLNKSIQLFNGVSTILNYK